MDLHPQALQQLRLSSAVAFTKVACFSEILHKKSGLLVALSFLHRALISFNIRIHVSGHSLDKPKRINLVS